MVLTISLLQCCSICQDKCVLSCTRCWCYDGVVTTQYTVGFSNNVECTVVELWPHVSNSSYCNWLTTSVICVSPTIVQAYRYENTSSGSSKPGKQCRILYGITFYIKSAKVHALFRNNSSHALLLVDKRVISARQWQQRIAFLCNIHQTKS